MESGRKQETVQQMGNADEKRDAAVRLFGALSGVDEKYLAACEADRGVKRTTHAGMLRFVRRYGMAVAAVLCIALVGVRYVYFEGGMREEIALDASFRNSAQIYKGITGSETTENVKEECAVEESLNDCLDGAADLGIADRSGDAESAGAAGSVNGTGVSGGAGVQGGTSDAGGAGAADGTNGTGTPESNGTSGGANGTGASGSNGASGGTNGTGTPESNGISGGANGTDGYDNAGAQGGTGVSGGTNDSGVADGQRGDNGGTNTGDQEPQGAEKTPGKEAGAGQADFEIAVDATNLNSNMREITLAEAEKFAVAGGFLPSVWPKDGGLESVRGNDASGQEQFSLTWTYGNRWDSFFLSVQNLGKTVPEEIQDSIVDVAAPETYDVGLYEIPYADSVPKKYRVIFQDPVFKAEEFTRACVEARIAGQSGDSGDTDTPRGAFRVLYTDPKGNYVLVRFNGRGSVDEVWNMMQSIGKQ